MELIHRRYLHPTYNYLSYFQSLRETGAKSDSKLLHKKLDELWESNKVPVLDTKNKKYAIQYQACKVAPSYQK